MRYLDREDIEDIKRIRVHKWMNKDIFRDAHGFIQNIIYSLNTQECINKQRIVNEIFTR